MPDRIRYPLIVLVAAACIAARASGALGAVNLSDRQDPQRVAGSQTRFIGFARRLLGVPYSYGGTSPVSGFDCSGFTRYVYAHFGVELPHYSVAQYELGQRVARADLEPGDLVFFDGLGHVGAYVGDGRFIHAPHTGSRVSVDRMSGWYASRYDGARRILQ
jgi:cell wall-associated NlpC family hydrolase